MKRNSLYTWLAGIVCALGAAGSTSADSGFEMPGGSLAGQIFAVEARVVLSLDPLLPEGTVFDNCYFFNDDGTWFDPLFPDLGIVNHPGFSGGFLL